jgi:hypothetical protein
MAERKVFNIIKAVPGVGQAYGAVRGAVYVAKGDMHEARHSVALDLADLNPLKIPKNLAHGIASIANDFNEGAWIGRRPLFNQPLGLTISGVTTLGPAGAQPHHLVFKPHHPDF